MLRLHIKKRLALPLVGAVCLLVASLAWSAAHKVGRETSSDISVVLSNRAAKQAVVPDQPVADPNVLARRLDGVLVPRESANLFPVASMFDNNPSARPPAGLSKASVVYETLVEGGATRFMGVFSPDIVSGTRIGPIRSSREAYLEWLSEYDGLYVHAGGSPEALEMLSGFGLHDLNCLSNGASYCYRDTSGVAPYNLFTNGDQFAIALKDFSLTDRVPTFTTWRFKDPDELNARGTFTELKLIFSSGTYNARYTYDREKNVYPRFQGADDPHRDRNTGEQIAPANVIVQVIPPIVSVREKGRLTLNVTGTGKAFLFRDGLVIPGHWEKSLRVERTRFIAEDGTEMKLNRGQTFVEIIPEGHEFPYR